MDKYKVKKDGVEIEVSEKRIRRCYLRVYPSGRVAVSVPVNYGQARTERFIIDHMDWIKTKLAQTAENIEEEVLYYLGEKITMEEAGVSRQAFFESKRVVAYKLFNNIIEEYLINHPEFLPKPKLAVRSMVSWGLYNKQKRLITLNLKLLQADIESIRMVIFHELCHIKEQNHSPRFYALLSKEFPDYKRIRREMKKYNTRI